MGNNFILASASPRRKDLLNQIGYYDFDILPVDIDETPLKDELPTAYVKRVAKEKALSSYKKNKGQVIIACDTIVAMGRNIIQKPIDKQDAKKIIERLSGRSHKVLSAISAIDKEGNQIDRIVLTRVLFKRLSKEEIDSYIDSGQWHDKAGGYAVQQLAGAFIKKIIGSYSSIVGLPLLETANILKGLGIKPSNK